MNDPNEQHVVELAYYGAILVPSRVARNRPGMATARCEPRVLDLFHQHPLSHDPTLDRIALYFAVTGEEHMDVLNKKIRRVKPSGKTLFIDVIVPLWAIEDTTDGEFDQVAEAVLLLGLACAAKATGHEYKQFVEAVESMVTVPRLASMVEHGLRTLRTSA